MSRFIPSHNLTDYIHEILPFGDPHRYDDLLELIEIAYYEGYDLWCIETIGTKVEFKDGFKPIFSESAFAYKTNNCGDAYAFREWMLVKKTNVRDRAGKLIQLDFLTKRGFVVSGYAGSPEHFEHRIIELARV